MEELIEKYFENIYTDKKNKVLHICNTAVNPGEEISLAMQLPEVLDLTPMYMPIKIKHGQKAGPCLLIIGSLHGDGFNGIEIINKVKLQSAISKINGTLICVPAINVFGMVNRSRVTVDHKVLNSIFPGAPDGTYSERLAEMFVKNIFDIADICINIETGGKDHYNIPQVYTNFESEISSYIARSLKVNIISECDAKEGTLEKVAFERDKIFVTLKSGEAMRFDSKLISSGVKGIINVLRQIGMIAKNRESGKTTDNLVFNTQGNEWVQAPKSGLCIGAKKLGEHVKKG